MFWLAQLSKLKGRRYGGQNLKIYFKIYFIFETEGKTVVSTLFAGTDDLHTTWNEPNLK